MTRRIRGAFGSALLALCGAMPLTALAQGDLIAPRALTSPLPAMPTNAREVPVEGYVTVRYSVLADGKPTNVRAIDFMPPSIDPAPTVATVGTWTFLPGTRAGQAIDWHNNETVVVFRSSAGVEVDSTGFAERYAAIETMLAAISALPAPGPGDYAEALTASQGLLNEYSTRLADTGLAMVQSAIIEIGLGSLNAALGYLRGATDPRVPMLSGTELLPALQLRMQLEGSLGRIADAQASYARLAKGLGDSPADAEFTETGARLANAEKEDFVSVTGRIVKDSWRIDANRRLFFIPEVKSGTIRTIVAECDTRRVELAFNSADDYQLPDSFGACTIFVNGDRNTDFTFVQALPPAE